MRNIPVLVFMITVDALALLILITGTMPDIG